MFCGNCGANNKDGVAFCENCGAPMVANTQPANAQPTYAPEYAPAAPAAPAAPKKNLLPIIIGAAAVVVVVILLIVLLSGGNGAGSPEDAALDVVEGTLTFDADQVLSAMYPDMYDDDDEEELREGLEETEELYDSMNISVSDFEVSKVKDIDEDRYDDYEDKIEDKFDIDVEITDMKKVTVSYVIDRNGKDEEGSQTITVMEIDGTWYALPNS